MHIPKRTSQNSTVSIATGLLMAAALPISNWLFYPEGGASFNRVAMLSVVFFPIPNYMSDPSWVCYSLCYMDIHYVTCLKINTSNLYSLFYFIHLPCLVMLMFAEGQSERAPPQQRTGGDPCHSAMAHCSANHTQRNQRYNHASGWEESLCSMTLYSRSQQWSLSLSIKMYASQSVNVYLKCSCKGQISLQSDSGSNW